MMEAIRFASIGETISPLWLGCASSPPLVTAFACYFDDSHRFDGSGRGDVLAIAGYVAPVWVWDGVFREKWSELLKTAPRPISEYKASDLESGYGEFAEWSRKERLTFGIGAVSAIGSHAFNGQILGLGTALEVPHVQDDAHRRDLHAFAYRWCAGWAMLQVFAWTRSWLLADASRLHFIFDYQKKLRVGADEAFDLIRNDFFSDIDVEVRRPQFEHSHELLPLQAADLLAFETYKEMYNRMLPGQPYPPRKALQVLVEGHFHYADYLEQGEFLAFQKNPYLFTRDGREYRAPILYCSKGNPRIRPPRQRRPFTDLDALLHGPDNS